MYLSTISSNHEMLFYHCVTLLNTPTYRAENEGALRLDWPRIPLPAKKKVLLDSAKLGQQVAALLDTEKPVVGVTSGAIRKDLKPLGTIQRIDGKQIGRKKAELEVTAGWGHAGKGGVCMPGKGKIVERKGGEALDVFLNDDVLWANIPRAVWDYHIGGYQVIKKWLSYRESRMLGRSLTMDEALYVTEMVRRIAALILLQPELDANYQTVKKNTWPWPKG
jgi:Type ISP C-terminal specificity domain